MRSIVISLSLLIFLGCKTESKSEPSNNLAANRSADAASSTEVEPADFPNLFESLLKSSDQYIPGVSASLRQEMQQLTNIVRTQGLTRLHPFAIRGVGAANLSETPTGKKPGDLGVSLGDLNAAGFLSESGGNFYVFDPRNLGEGINAENFVMRLFASIAAVNRYAYREKNPIIIAIDLKKFPIINSKGIDGIDGGFPVDVVLHGHSFLFRCLDVGMVTRPGVAVGKPVTRANGVPLESIFNIIGGKGLPSGIRNLELHEGAEAPQNARVLWIFHEFLSSWLKLN